MAPDDTTTAPRRPHKPRTRAAAAAVLKSTDEVQEANDAARAHVTERRGQIGERLWEGIADKKLPKAQAKTMLTDLFGTSPAKNNAGKNGGKVGGNKKGGKSGPDTAAAAQALGVSQRTVQRWVKEGLPKSPAAQQLRQKWADSPAARKRQVSPERKKRMRDSSQGMSVTITGRFIVSGGDRSAGTTRTVQINDFTPAGRQALIDAMLANDMDAAYDALIEGVQRGFGGSVDLDIDLDAIQINW